MVQGLVRKVARGVAMALALGLGLVAGLAVGLAQAQDAPEPATAMIAPDVSPAAAPDEAALARLQKRLKSNPDGVLKDAAQAILAAADTAPRDAACADGVAGKGLDAAGAARVVEIERARLRAAAMGDWLAADLDNDGAVSGPEAAAYLPMLSASDRADRALALLQADSNGDGLADAAELRAAAQAQALARFDADEAGAVLALVSLDGDGDGMVTLAEARAAAAP